MGEFYAVSCALVWALAVVFFRKSGEYVDPFALNLFRVAVSIVLLLAIFLSQQRDLEMFDQQVTSVKTMMTNKGEKKAIIAFTNEKAAEEILSRLGIM